MDASVLNVADDMTLDAHPDNHPADHDAAAATTTDSVNATVDDALIAAPAYFPAPPVEELESNVR